MVRNQPVICGRLLAQWCMVLCLLTGSVSPCNPSGDAEHSDSESLFVASARELVDQSSTVVVADVVSAVARRDSETGLIFTDYTAQVKEALKGENKVEVRFSLEGGEKDGLILTVSDVPSLASDREYMLFMSGTSLLRAVETEDRNTVKAAFDEYTDSDLVAVVREMLAEREGEAR